MTVYEVIQELAKHPPDALVVVNLSVNERANGKTVRSVRMVAAQRWPNSDNWQEDYYNLPDDELQYAAVIDITA